MNTSRVGQTLGNHPLKPQRLPIQKTASLSISDARSEEAGASIRIKTFDTTCLRTCSKHVQRTENQCWGHLTYFLFQCHVTDKTYLRQYYKIAYIYIYTHTFTGKFSYSANDMRQTIHVYSYCANDKAMKYLERHCISHRFHLQFCVK